MENLNNPLEQQINQLNTDMLKRLEQQLEICKNALQNRKFEKICSELYDELEFDILKNLQDEFPNDQTNEVIANKYLQSVWAIHNHII